MNDELKRACATALHETLRSMVSSLVMAGMEPMEALEFVEYHLSMIRTTVENAVERSKGNDPVADVRVRRVVSERVSPEEAEVVEAPEEGGHVPDVRGERHLRSASGNPRRTTGTDNQADWRIVGQTGSGFGIA